MDVRRVVSNTDSLRSIPLIPDGSTFFPSQPSKSTLAPTLLATSRQSQPITGGNFPQNQLSPSDPSQPGNKPLRMDPQGRSNPDFREEQIKTPLKAQRQVQHASVGVESYDNNSSVPKLRPPSMIWNKSLLPAGPASFSSRPPKSTLAETFLPTSRQSQPLMGGSISQNSLSPRDPSQPGDTPLRMNPQGSGNPDFREEQTRAPLKAQRQVQHASVGVESYDNNNSVPNLRLSSFIWNEPSIPVGPAMYPSQPPKSTLAATLLATSRQSHPMMGRSFPQNSLPPCDPSQPGGMPLRMDPQGSGNPDFREEQIKTTLKVQRQVQHASDGVKSYDSNNCLPKSRLPLLMQNEPLIPAGPALFPSQPSKSTLATTLFATSHQSQPMMGGNVTQNSLSPRDPTQPGDTPLRMDTQGCGNPDSGEEQIKTSLNAQREVQHVSAGVESYDNNSNIPKLRHPLSQWNEPLAPVGTNSFPVQPLKPTLCAPNAADQEKSSDQSNSGTSPERELTPSPEYSTPNGYSSEDETEEKSDRSFSEQLCRTLSNLKRKSPENTTSNEEYMDHDDVQPSQHQIVKTTILSLPVTPVTPPLPRSPSALDRNSMEASSTTNDLVALPKDLTQLLPSIHTNTSFSTSFESNTSSSDEKHDSRSIREQFKSGSILRSSSSKSDSDRLSEEEQDREEEKEQRILEMDLSIFRVTDLPSLKDSRNNSPKSRETSPIKEETTHKVHQYSKEIDASIYSHSPVEYRLTAMFIAKPDYSDMLVKQNIPASKVQQDPRLRNNLETILGTISSTSNMNSNDRRCPEDGLEIRPPPSPTKAKRDPRMNKGKIVQNIKEQAKNQHEFEDVKDPQKVLNSSKTQIQSHCPQLQQNDKYNQEIYVPTQDVQGKYLTKPKNENDVFAQEDQVRMVDEDGMLYSITQSQENPKSFVSQEPPSNWSIRSLFKGNASYTDTIISAPAHSSDEQMSGSQQPSEYTQLQQNNHYNQVTCRPPQEFQDMYSTKQKNPNNISVQDNQESGENNQKQDLNSNLRNSFNQETSSGITPMESTALGRRDPAGQPHSSNDNSYEDEGIDHKFYILNANGDFDLYDSPHNIHTQEIEDIYSAKPNNPNNDSAQGNQQSLVNSQRQDLNSNSRNSFNQETSSGITLMESTGLERNDPAGQPSSSNDNSYEGNDQNNYSLNASGDSDLYRNPPNDNGDIENSVAVSSARDIQGTSMITGAPIRKVGLRINRRRGPRHTK